MLNYTDFWPALGLTIGVGMLVTVALCLLVAMFSPDWFRPRRPRQAAVATARHPAHDHRDHGDYGNHREPKAA